MKNSNPHQHSYDNGIVLCRGDWSEPAVHLSDINVFCEIQQGKLVHNDGVLFLLQLHSSVTQKSRSSTE
jgi:hypothetical protein